VTDKELSNIRYILVKHGITSPILGYTILDEGPDNLALSIQVNSDKFLLVADDHLNEDEFYAAKAKLNCGLKKIKLLVQYRADDEYETTLGGFMVCRLYKLSPL
jgi:hypothetical protein